MSEHELEERIRRLENLLRRLDRNRDGVQALPGLNRLGQDTTVAGILTVDGLIWDGWQPDSDVWEYVSETSFKIAGKDACDRFPVGTMIKLAQTTVKYFYVVKAEYVTDTTVTVTGGTNYGLANATITDPCYSYVATPQGFPRWFNWTPSWSASGSMTFTPSTNQASFCIVGRIVHFKHLVSGTTGGTASNYLKATPPVLIVAGTGYIGSSRIQDGSGVMVGGYMENIDASYIYCGKDTTANFGIGTYRGSFGSGFYQI